MMELNKTQAMVLKILANQSRGVEGDKQPGHVPYVETTFAPVTQLFKLIRQERFRAFNIDRAKHDTQRGSLPATNNGWCTDEAAFTKMLEELEAAKFITFGTFTKEKRPNARKSIDCAITKEGAEAIGDTILVAAFSPDKTGKLPDYAAVHAQSVAAAKEREKSKAEVKAEAKPVVKPAKPAVKIMAKKIAEPVKTPKPKTTFGYTPEAERTAEEDLRRVLGDSYEGPAR